MQRPEHMGAHEPVRQRRLVLLAAAALISMAPSVWGAMPTGFQEVVTFGGLKFPTNVRFAPDGSAFVTEKSGIIKLFRSLTDTAPLIFADLSSNVMDQWDRGLLGIALDPKFPTAPYVYVLYTYDAPPGKTAPYWKDACDDPVGVGCTVTARLSRLEMGAGGTMIGAEKVLIENNWCAQFPSHSIGDLAFGPDGALYVSAGDGANFNVADNGQTGANPCSDVPQMGGALRAQSIFTGQHPTSLDGSILRVDPKTGDALAGNPLMGGSTDDDRIVAFGLRNPFRMNFRPGTQELWIADVGWSTTEEINRVASASDSVVENFGWPCYEGDVAANGYSGMSLCGNLYTSSPGPGVVTGPYFSYQHGRPPGGPCTGCDGAAVTGIAFYSGTAYPAAYRDALFFCDYAHKYLWAMLKGDNQNPDPKQIVTISDNAPDPVSLQTGPGGDIFYVNHGGDTGAGDVRRIFFSSNQVPTAVASADVNTGAAPLAVHFSAAASTDPEGKIVAYAWDLDGDGDFDDSTAVAPAFTYTKPGIYLVSLRVTDANGSSGSTNLRILVNNTVPVATIATPSDAFTWKVGDTITFSGQGTDLEDGALPASAMTWSATLMHCPSDDCHPHALQEFDGVTGGSFTAPDHEYPSYLQVRLTVQDSSGLTGTTALALYPRTASLSIDTVPSGLTITVGATKRVSPVNLRVIEGSRQTVSTSLVQTMGGLSYAFVDWSDRGPTTHEITTRTGDAPFTARFAEVPMHRGDTVIAAIADTRPADDMHASGCGCFVAGGRSPRAKTSSRALVASLASCAAVVYLVTRQRRAMRRRSALASNPRRDGRSAGERRATRRRSARERREFGRRVFCMVPGARRIEP